MNKGEQGASPGRSSRMLRVCAWAALIILALLIVDWPAPAQAAPVNEATGAAFWTQFFPMNVMLAVAACLLLSAFFSACEAAFFSLNNVRLKSMSEEHDAASKMVAALMEKPGRLLTTILVASTAVNVLVIIMLGSRLETLFDTGFQWSPVSSYVAAVLACSFFIVFFGEIIPKVVALGASERVARASVALLLLFEWMLGPVCRLLLWITNAIFAITRFDRFRAAPFITDDELKAVFVAGEAQAVIQKNEREMIQGILEVNDVLLREIVAPRPDVVAISEDATVAEAIEILREQEYSRMPVYRDDLDHITGVLVAKDLLPSFANGQLDQPVKTLARPAHFVPETMTVQQYIKDAQRRRAHLAIVVDEYGGTAGIVALEDALELVVGDIRDENDNEAPPYVKLGEGEYRVEGSLSLDVLSEVLGVTLEDEEHETLAGFIMNHTDKILEPGDQLEHGNIVFVVEECEGKRACMVRVKIEPASEVSPAVEQQAS